MYLSSRAAQARNFALATVNGSITLIILLIAPLGLAAVIINTVLIALATFITGNLSDYVIRYLTPAQPKAYLDSRPQSSALDRHRPHDLDRY